jgi:hypothetical protein
MDGIQFLRSGPHPFMPRQMFSLQKKLVMNFRRQIHNLYKIYFPGIYILSILENLENGGHAIPLTLPPMHHPFVPRQKFSLQKKLLMNFRRQIRNLDKKFFPGIYILSILENLQNGWHAIPPTLPPMHHPFVPRQKFSLQKNLLMNFRRQIRNLDKKFFPGIYILSTLENFQNGGHPIPPTSSPRVTPFVPRWTFSLQKNIVTNFIR